MTYRNLCSWQPLPTFEDGDIVDGGNLRYPVGLHATTIDGGKKVRFTSMTLWNAPTTLPPIDCLVVFGPLPKTEEQDDTDFDKAKEEAKEILAPIKPIADQFPSAVKTAIGELFTPEEFNGVMGAE